MGIGRTTCKNQKGLDESPQNQKGQGLRSQGTGRSEFNRGPGLISVESSERVGAFELQRKVCCQQQYLQSSHSSSKSLATLEMNDQHQNE